MSRGYLSPSMDRELTVFLLISFPFFYLFVSNISPLVTSVLIYYSMEFPMPSTLFLSLLIF